jgi:hypothetical protein
MRRKSYPTSSSYCKTCGLITPHELRGCAGATVQICRQCLERVMSYLKETPGRQPDKAVGAETQDYHA